MPGVLKINHVAVAVNDSQESLSFWRDALGLRIKENRLVPEEDVRVTFLPIADCEIELVQPTVEGSGLTRFLEKRGQGLHHVCLEVDDLDGLIIQLKEKKVRFIGDTPRVSSDGRKYAFVHPDSTSGVLVELYESLV